MPSELIDRYANALLRRRKRRRDTLEASEKIIQRSPQECILTPESAQKVEAWSRSSFPPRSSVPDYRVEVSGDPCLPRNPLRQNTR